RPVSAERVAARRALDRADHAGTGDVRIDRDRTRRAGVAAMAQVILAVELAAFWPVWIWWARRIAAEPEAAWGLLALATAVLFAWRARPAPRTALPWSIAALMAVYGLSFWFATPIFRAGIAVAAIGITLARSPGVTGLC